MKSRKTIRKSHNSRKSVKRAPKVSRLYALVAAVVVLAAGGYLLSRNFTASAELSLKPESSSVSVGDSLNVEVRVDPKSAIDGVQATIIYDPDMLTFVSINSDASAFPVELKNTGTDGTIQITRGAFAPTTISDDSLVAEVTFKANQAVSRTNLELSGQFTSEGTYLNPSTSNGTVTIKD